MKKFPIITFTFILACVVIHCLGLGDALQWSRGAGLSRSWTLITCHLTHWSASHLLWNMLALGLLGGWIEHQDRRALIRGLSWSMLLIMPIIAPGMPGLDIYRGLSGVASALFVMMAITLWRRKDEPFLRTSAALALMVFIGKCAYEHITGDAAFADLSNGILACPLAHLAGGLAGWLSCMPRLTTAWPGILPACRAWSPSRR